MKALRQPVRRAVEVHDDLRQFVARLDPLGILLDDARVHRARGWMSSEHLILAIDNFFVVGCAGFALLPARDLLVLFAIPHSFPFNAGPIAKGQS